ncbi:HEAT repeat domain-containing protein [Frigoriglobus tundricola]|uniref:Uncharacterized protein n=1 Tax=Frigoriglobus tundricola TaxID=2774151 RepID=A0A6M5YT97_9BACT|nr:HEAT repeat domain-containing protein [Frigoriglobus tundricola]QJW96162.1 hypothetical protein FTUN_3718 [Frigoriglobus tundricola]
MRRTAPLALFFGLTVAAGGCGKKAPEVSPGPEGRTAVQPSDPPEDTAAARLKLLSSLKGTNQEARRKAIEDLSWLAEEDPAVLPALVELLKDKNTAGSGRTLANQINSTREAAALTILKCTNGDRVMKEKGLAALREGLTDPAPAVREHIAYTIGQLGPIAKPLAPDVQMLCTDPDKNVRGVAFDTLRVTGVADPVALVRLLTHTDEDVVLLASELVPLLPDVPVAAIGPLTEALVAENPNVRYAAAEGLATAGPNAAAAVQALTDAVKKSYPAEFDRKTARLSGPEMAYWKALGRTGEPAVVPTAKLLDHSNLLVRMLAVRTLGEIGAPAKVAKDALKKALNDTTVNVAVEAAAALCKLGEAQEDAVALMKRAMEATGEGVAGYAIEAIPRLGEVGKPLVPLALAKMADADPNTRLAAVLLVGLLPPSEATKAASDVGKRLTDDVPEIRSAAGRVLEQLGPVGAPAADALGRALQAEKEENIRDQFVEALVAMGPGAKAGLPGLLPLVAEKGLPIPLRTKAITGSVTADPGSPDVATALEKAAGDSNFEIRVAAADAMGHLNPLPAAPLDRLLKMAKNDARNDPRVAALRGLTTAGIRAKAAGAELDAIVAGPQPGLALLAQVARASVDGNPQRASDAVRKGLTDRNSQVRAAAAESLLFIGPKPIDLPALLKLLMDANRPTRVAAATGVGRIGSAAKDAVPQLTRLLNDNTGDVRIAAAAALGDIGTAPKATVAKLRDLQRNDPVAKFAAQRAINKLGEK